VNRTADDDAALTTPLEPETAAVKEDA